MVKKVLKITILVIVAFILALFVAAYVFRDKIMNEFKKQVTENINATVDWKDFDISFLRSFPQLNIKLQDLSVIGVDTFDQIPLFTSKETELDFNILPFIKGNEKPSIKYFAIDGALINVVVLSDSIANYLITKETSGDTSTFNLELDEYEIKNSKLYYTDNTLALRVTALGLNHKGNGNIGSTIYDLDTDSKVDSLTIDFEGFKYLQNVSASLKSVINVNLADEKYTFNNADISLNKLLMNGNASFQAKDGGWDMTCDIKNNGDSFKNILSVLPYIDQSKDVKADGIATLILKVNGYFHGEKELYPTFDIKTMIKNGSAQYTGLPYPLKNVQLDAHITSTHPKMKDLNVNVKQLDLSVNNERIQSSFNISDAMTDALVDGKLNGAITLENWVKALPLQGVEKLSGTINSNITLNARQSAIENQKYEAIKFSGAFTGKNIVYKVQGSPALSIGDFTFDAAPAKMTLNANNIVAGNTQLNAGGELVNPLAYFSDVKNVTGTINVNAKKIDFNEWMTPANTTSASPANTVPMDLSAYKFNAVTTNISAEEVLYDTYILKNFALKGNFGLQNLNIENFTTTIDKSDIAVKGQIANVYDYLFENGLLTGNISLVSNNFDANQFMTNEKSSSSDSLMFLVPESVAIDIDANVKNLTYTNMNLTNLKGNVAIKNQSISMYDCKASMLGGDVGLDGLYDSKGAKPLFNVKLNLNRIQFPKAFEQFVTIKQIAPVMKYIEGLFNTTLVMEGNLNKGMVPDLSTLSASGLIETLNGAIKGLKPLSAAGDKLGVSSLSPFSLKDTKNWFDIKNGNVEIKEFTKEIDDIGIKMKGNHKIQGPMDYEMIVKIPRAKLKKSGLTSGLEKGWSFIEKEAGKKGIDVAQGEFVDVKINIGGKLLSPDLKFTILGTSGKSMKEELQEEVTKSFEQAKDSIRREAEKKIEQAKDSLKRLGEKELDKAKKKAEDEATKVLNEAKDKAKKEIENKIDSLVGKTVSDSLKKKAEEVIKNKSGKEVDEIKDKIKDWNPFKKKK